MAQVAQAWASAKPGITSLLLGARTIDQLRDNLASVDVRITPEQFRVLDESSALEPIHPYMGFTPEVNRGIFGGATVEGWREPAAFPLA